MSDQKITIVLPLGGTRSARIPNDMPARDLIPQLTSMLDLPALDAEGLPLAYRLDRRDNRLFLTADLTAGAPIFGGGNESPRMRRLRGDHDLMVEMAARSDLITFKAVAPRPNVPPERYIITFNCKSIIGIDGSGKPKYGNTHQVEIYLHNQYPHRWPGMKWLTPIWHPNISHLNGSVCIDAAWWTASRSLDRLVIMLGEMLQWKNFHDDPTKPPFPLDPDAARWSREYRKKHANEFPTDMRELLRPERVKMKTAAEPPKKKPTIRLK